MQDVRVSICIYVSIGCLSGVGGIFAGALRNIPPMTQGSCPRSRARFH